jgi:hypothetical protein
MVKKLLGVADIAAIFGVEAKTVSMWRQRYPDFPEPDVLVGDVAGWDPSRRKEFEVWESRRPGRGRRSAAAEHVEEVLRRIFVYQFMRPDDFAWAPVVFPGARYDREDRLVEGMQIEGAAHLVKAIRADGYEFIFEDPDKDAVEAMRRVLWDSWTESEVGKHQFIGRLFDEYGQIYRGCTAFDAARYTLQRLAAIGCELQSIHQA